MRTMILARGIAWVGAVVTWWSLNVVWGTDIDAGKGPPGQWQRQVVGAGLLALIAAVTITATGRGGKSPGKVARGVALAASLSVALIVYLLRRAGLASFPHLLAGAGWTWLLAGGGFLLAATTLTYAAAQTPTPEESAANKKGKPGAKRRKKRR